MPPVNAYELTASSHAVELSEAQSARGSLLYTIGKRALDLAVSSVMIVLLAPLLGAIALAIRLESRGPALFRQTRIGMDGRPFVIYKFRSMRQENSDAAHRAYVASLIKGTAASQNGSAGTVYKLLDDDRITRIGRVIRRTSIDELPQLFNVVMGNMSLVGPRPPLPYEVALYDRRHMRRLEVKPGVTGLWQVSGRNALSFEQMIDLDVEYVERRSLRLELSILARTPGAVLHRTGG